MIPSDLVEQMHATAEEVRATGKPVANLHRFGEMGFEHNWQIG